MSIEHATPRPWEIHVGQLLIDVHRGNYLIADLVNPARSHEEAAANAELIVTAVNAYDDLVERLTDTAQRYHHYCPGRDDFATCRDPMCATNRAVLAKARGETVPS